MTQTEQSWRQELAEIDAEIEALKRRQKAQQVELCTLQDLRSAAPESEPTPPYRANFLSCKLDETEQRLCTLELRKQALTLKLRTQSM